MLDNGRISSVQLLLLLFMMEASTAYLIATVILSKVVFGDAYSKLTGFLFGTWPPYAAIVELVIPAIILLVAVIRKKERTAIIAGSAGPDSGKNKKVV